MIRPAILCILLLAVWLFAGRRLSLLLDWLFTIRIASQPVSFVHYDGGRFLLGDSDLTFASIDNHRFDLNLRSDSQGRLILSTGGRSFPLGPRATPADPSGRPEVDFTPEPGDEVSLIARRSAIGWPTPFEFHIMKPRSPWWKRYVYYRLVWKKPSGAKLEMLWRYEQHFYRPGGWTKPAMLWNSQTGLVRVDIQPAASTLEEVTIRYIGRTKGWRRSQYRIENQGPSADGHSDVVAVIFVQDERSPHPGGGQSVVLYVDRDSREVTRELGGQ